MDKEHVPEFELEKTDAYGKYMLTGRVEILFVLRALHKHQSLATVYFDHGNAFLLTTILAVDEAGDSLILDLGSEETMNQAARKAVSLILTAKLDKVKIQFPLVRLEAAEFAGRPAFRAPLPGKLLRLQRREYFRLETPVTPVLLCQAPIPRGEGLLHAEELKILDLSGGGVSLMVPEAAAEFLPVGALVQNCRIALPEEGIVVATLCVRSAVPVSNRSGHHFIRAGCEFIDLPGQRLTMIQRFITRIERERKARLAGLE